MRAQRRVASSLDAKHVIDLYFVVQHKLDRRTGLKFAQAVFRVSRHANLDWVSGSADHIDLRRSGFPRGRRVNLRRLPVSTNARPCLRCTRLDESSGLILQQILRCPFSHPAFSHRRGDAACKLSVRHLALMVALGRLLGLERWKVFQILDILLEPSPHGTLPHDP